MTHGVITDDSSHVMQVLIKERFTRVNADIAALHVTQKAWTIPDSTLRASIKEAIYTQFLPAYQASRCTCLSPGIL